MNGLPTANVSRRRGSGIDFIFVESEREACLKAAGRLGETGRKKDLEKISEIVVERSRGMYLFFLSKSFGLVPLLVSIINMSKRTKLLVSLY